MIEEQNVINYGQHFLNNKETIDKFLALAELENREVIEIGPGTGVLTEQIAPLAKRLTCFEIDTKLKNELEKKISKFSNVTILYQNFLNATISHCDTIISGLPYQILEPFLKKLVHIDFKQTLIIIGKNYAHSLYRENFLNEEVKFTNLLTKCFFFVNVYDDIAPVNFMPPPKTISSIVELKKRDKITLLESQELYFIRELIEQGDKKIKNALMEAMIHYYRYQDKNITKKQAKAILQRLELGEDILESTLDTLNNRQLTEIYCKFKNNSIHL